METITRQYSRPIENESEQPLDSQPGAALFLPCVRVLIISRAIEQLYNHERRFEGDICFVV